MMPWNYDFNTEVTLVFQYMYIIFYIHPYIIAHGTKNSAAPPRFTKKM